jgi:hypothetical protein
MEKTLPSECVRIQVGLNLLPSNWVCSVHTEYYGLRNLYVPATTPVAASRHFAAMVLRLC